MDCRGYECIQGDGRVIMAIGQARELCALDQIPGEVVGRGQMLEVF